MSRRLPFVEKEALFDVLSCFDKYQENNFTLRIEADMAVFDNSPNLEMLYGDKLEISDPIAKKKLRLGKNYFHIFETIIFETNSFI